MIAGAAWGCPGNAAAAWTGHAAFEARGWVWNPKASQHRGD